MSFLARNLCLRILTMLVLALFLLPVPGAMADTPMNDEAVPADPGSRAQGAEDVGRIPGKINYYKDGYPLKQNVLYTFNMSFSIERNATHSEVLNYIGRVDNFQARFYDGSDGQMAIERVDVWNNKRMWQKVDTRWYTQSGRAFTFRGGISSEDAHIYMFGGDSGKVLHHEWGHYAIFLPDEYTDSGGAFCTCIMGSTWNTDQYCCDGNHNYNHAYSESKSCWQQIVDRYDHVTEKDPPVSGPWDEPPITYVWHELLDLETKDDNMSISPPTPSTGETLQIKVSFYNLNYSVDGSQKFTLFDGDPSSGGVAIDTQVLDISGDEEFELVWYIKASQGLNDFWVVADPDNAVKEVNENNNVARGQIYVNVPPTIDPSMPGTYEGSEDHAIEVDLTDYEMDAEDTNAELVWTIMDYDNETIVELDEDLAEDRFVFTPKEDWFGTTEVEVRLTDTAGAYVDASFKLDFESVNDIPSVTELERDLDNIIRGSSVQVLLRGTDIETMPKFLTPEIEFRSVTKDWTALQASYNDGFRATLPTDYDSDLGLYSIRGRVIDAHGGDSGWAYLNDTFNVTNNEPSILGITIPEDVLFRTETIPVQVAAKDLEDSAVEFVWEVEVQDPSGEWGAIDNDLTYGDGYHEFEFSPDEEAPLGAYHFRARAWDKDGGCTGWLEDATDVIVMNNLPTTESVEVDGTEVLRTQSLTLFAKGSDIEDGRKDLIPTFQYSFGQGWTDEYLAAPIHDDAAKEWSSVFTAPEGAPLGGVKFRVRFTDLDGDVSDWKETKAVQVRNNPPTASMSGPLEGKEGAALHFFGSNSSDVEGQVSYQWSFGDGQTSNQADPEVKFRRAGTFDVTLSVKDPNGLTDSDTMTVKITKRPAPPPTIIDTPGQSTLFGGFGLLAILALVIVLVMIIALAAYMVRRKRRSQLPPDDLGMPLDGPSPAGGGLIPLTEASIDDGPMPIPEPRQPEEGPPPPPGPPPTGPTPQDGPSEVQGEELVGPRPSDPPLAEEPPRPGPPGPTSSDSPSS